MKKIFFASLLLLLFFIGYKIVVKRYESSSLEKETSLLADKKVDQTQVKEVKRIIKSNKKYNEKIAFFIDMKIPSGKNRFFVYDLVNNQILDQGLVAHGSGSETNIKGKLKFSNVPNSLSTSLGKYSIGKHYNGKFGKAYKLYGLDKTNSNAFVRDIVFHYYYDVPYNEQNGYICNSYGCPMVNKKYFERMAKIIDTSKSDILISIYY